MKTIFTLVASLIMSIAVFAAGGKPRSVLTVKSFDRGDIRLIIDGRRFEPNDNYMRIQGIEAGYHDVKIYRERNGGGFTIFGRRYEMVFNSWITIKPFSNVMIAVDRFGRASLNESRMNGRYGHDDRGFGDRNDRSFGDRDNRGFGDRNDNRDWDSNHDFNYDRGDNKGDYNKDRDGKRDGNDRDSHDGRNDNRDDRGYNDNDYNGAMSDFEFNRVLQSIDKEWMESNKLKSATQIVRTNSLTSIQVKQLVQLFSFESNKLDLAKQAYQNTVDKKNYFMVNDAFSFSSSKDELNRFIRNSR